MRHLAVIAVGLTFFAAVVHGFASHAGAAVLFGLTADGHIIVQFDSATPHTIVRAAAITGLQPGERIVGIDVTPLTGELFGVGIAPGVTDTGRLYRINSSTGVATQIGTGPFATDLRTAAAYGVDFEPFGFQLRIVNSAGENLRVNPGTGARMTDTDLTPGVPHITALAYDPNPFVNIPVGRLFGIDTTTDQLVTIGGLDGAPPPDTGIVFLVGPLGVDAVGDAGFDIEPVAGTLFAALTVGGQNGLYTINQTTGAAALVGPIGDGNLAITGLAVDRSVVTITISPPSGTYTTTQTFDLAILLNRTDFTMVLGGATFDGIAVTTALAGCLIRGTQVPVGGTALRCPGLTGALLGAGVHTLSVSLTFFYRGGLPATSATASATWTVVETTEP